jgi:hypothetical protein
MTLNNAFVILAFDQLNIFTIIPKHCVHLFHWIVSIVYLYCRAAAE